MMSALDFLLAKTLRKDFRHALMTTIWLLARGTFGEAIRRRTLLVFLLVAAAVLVLGAFTASFQPGRETVVVKTLGLGIIGLTGVFISVILGINLLPTEIERRTVYTILSKPVHRYQFVLGKFLGGLLTVLSSVAVMALVFLLLFVIKERGFDKEVVGVCQGLLLLLCQITIISAVAMFFSSFLSPFVNFFLTLAVYLLGISRSATEALADPASDPAHPKNLLVVYVFKVINFVIPDFTKYNVQNPILAPEVHITNQAYFVGLETLIALVYTAILLLGAVIVFERREV